MDDRVRGEVSRRTEPVDVEQVDVIHKRLPHVAVLQREELVNDLAIEVVETVEVLK